MLCGTNTRARPLLSWAPSGKGTSSRTCSPVPKWNVGQILKTTCPLEGWRYVLRRCESVECGSAADGQRHVEHAVIAPDHIGRRPPAHRPRPFCCLKQSPSPPPST